jgi:hypothetical protein
MWNNTGELQRSQRIWCMRTACWIPKATNTHRKYVILLSFHCNNGLLTPLHVTYSWPVLYVYVDDPEWSRWPCHSLDHQIPSCKNSVAMTKLLLEKTSWGAMQPVFQGRRTFQTLSRSTLTWSPRFLTASIYSKNWTHQETSCTQCDPYVLGLILLTFRNRASYI